MNSQATASSKSWRWSRLSAAAVFDPRLSPACLRVLAAFGTYANEDARCYPGVGTIAKRLGVTRRMVQMHLRSLEQLNYITTRGQMRLRGGGLASNEYFLRYPDVDSLPVPKPRRCPQRKGSLPPFEKSPSRFSGRNIENARNAKTGFASGNSEYANGESLERGTVRSPNTGQCEGQMLSNAKERFALSNPNYNNPLSKEPIDSFDSEDREGKDQRGFQALGDVLHRVFKPADRA